MSSEWQTSILRHMTWLFWALLSALFAAATALLAKVGVAGIDSNLATAIRTSVILLFTWAIAIGLEKHHGLAEISRRGIELFLARFPPPAPRRPGWQGQQAGTARRGPAGRDRVGSAHRFELLGCGGHGGLDGGDLTHPTLLLGLPEPVGEVGAFPHVVRPVEDAVS